MKCFCGEKAETINSREPKDGSYVRRRKTCPRGHRFSTYENYRLTSAEFSEILTAEGGPTLAEITLAGLL